jgi:hypothetical protein
MRGFLFYLARLKENACKIEHALLPPLSFAFIEVLRHFTGCIMTAMTLVTA